MTAISLPAEARDAAVPARRKSTLPHLPNFKELLLALHDDHDDHSKHAHHAQADKWGPRAAVAVAPPPPGSPLADPDEDDCTSDADDADLLLRLRDAPARPGPSVGAPKRQAFEVALPAPPAAPADDAIEVLPPGLPGLPKQYGRAVVGALVAHAPACPPPNYKKGYLPPELVEKIVRRLRRPRDVLAAGRVGRVWWSYAKPHLYSHVRLPTAEHCHAFLLFLHRNPRPVPALPPPAPIFPRRVPAPHADPPSRPPTARPRAQTKPGPRIGTLDLSAPMLPGTFPGPAAMWSLLAPLIRLAGPVGRLLLPYAPAYRASDIGALRGASGCDEIDARGVRSPWMGGMLLSLPPARRLLLGDGRAAVDVPPPEDFVADPTADDAEMDALARRSAARTAGRRLLACLRLPGSPRQRWLASDPRAAQGDPAAYRRELLHSACARLAQGGTRELAVEMAEMGTWWSTANLGVVLAAFGDRLESFSVRLGAEDPKGDGERDVEMRRRGWRRRRSEIGEDEAAEEGEGMHTASAWSYGDETEFAALLSLLQTRSPSLRRLRLDMGGLVPLRVPEFVGLLVSLCARLERAELRTGEGVWRMLRQEGFGEAPHAHGTGGRRGSAPHPHLHAHGVGHHAHAHGHPHAHAVLPADGAPLKGFRGYAVEGGWIVVERRS